MLNLWQGMGRLTRDPELRTTGSGIAVASFSLAIDRDYKDEDGKRPTDFVSISCWRYLASFAQKYLKKGRMVCVTGRLQQQNWQDSNGNNRVSWSIQADRVYFADSQKTADNADAAFSDTQFTDLTDDPDDGELPF